MNKLDKAALQLALDLTLADEPPDGHQRIEQVQLLLKQDGWKETAEFCSYHQQMERLKLLPANSPPCWILYEEGADAILAEGFIPACHDPSIDISNYRSAVLLKRMLALGISAYHPDPLGAIAEAEKAKPKRKPERRAR